MMKSKKKNIQIGFIVVLLVLISICSFFAFYFYSLQKDIFSFNHIETNLHSKVIYKANLKDENYENLVQDEYLLDLIKNIDTYFDFSYALNKEVNGEYSYFVDGNIVFKTDDGKEILKREIYKSKEDKFALDGKLINITDNVTIKLDSILKEFEEIKKNYSVTDKVYARFDCHIKYSYKSDDINITKNDSETLSIIIPLSENKIKISTSKEKNEPKSIYSDIKIKDNINLIISFEFIGVVLLLITIILLIILNMVKRESKYESTLKNILSKYDDLIVEILDIPDMSKLDVLFVTDFKELIDASNNLNMPIVHFEVIPKRESIFAIIAKKQAYVYKLSSK